MAAFSTSNQLGVNLAQTNAIISTATPEYPGNVFALGTTTLSNDGGRYVYCAAPAALALGSVVYLDTAFNANLLTTAAAGAISGQKVGVASQVAFNAGDRGWIQVDGVCPAILVSASTAANSQLYTTSTAGQLSGTATSSVAVNGVITTTTNGGSAGVQPGILNNPEILLTT